MDIICLNSVFCILNITFYLFILLQVLYVSRLINVDALYFVTVELY